jgi:hypothetical protein
MQNVDVSCLAGNNLAELIRIYKPIQFRVLNREVDHAAIPKGRQHIRDLFSAGQADARAAALQ